MTVCAECRHMRTLTNRDHPDLPQDDPCCTHPDITPGSIDPVSGKGQWDRVLCETVNEGDCKLYRAGDPLRPTPIRVPPYDCDPSARENPADFEDHYEKDSASYLGLFWLVAGAALVAVGIMLR